MHDKSRHPAQGKFRAPSVRARTDLDSPSAYRARVSVWVVVRDADLRALLLTIGEEAGVPVAAVEPETVATLLNRDERPDAMLVSRSLVPRPLAPDRLALVARLVVASGELKPDGVGYGRFLQLPASLEAVEQSLSWLAAGDGQLEDVSRSEVSSRRA